MTTVLNFPEQITFYLTIFLGVLVSCSLIFGVFHKVKPSSLTFNLVQRTNSWWVIYILFIIFIGVSRELIYIGFALISFISHREMVSNINLPLTSRRTVFWSYLAIPIHYYFAYSGNLILFLTFLPVATLFLLSLRTIIEDEPEKSLQVFAGLHWSLMMTTFTISHVAYLASMPPVPGHENGYYSLFFFLIFLTSTNDIFQYIAGKVFGKKKISPKISPNKTYAGFFGGIIGSAGLGYAFSSSMPLAQSQCIVLAVVISITGFIGDLNISAIKRYLNVKDMSNFIPGHGGILDRIDSLTFSSIAYFYLVYYWIYV